MPILMIVGGIIHQLTRPVPNKEYVEIPTGVGAGVTTPVGDGVMGALVAPEVIGEPVPCIKYWIQC